MGIRDWLPEWLGGTPADRGPAPSGPGDIGNWTCPGCGRPLISRNNPVCPGCGRPMPRGIRDARPETVDDPAVRFADWSLKAATLLAGLAIAVLLAPKIAAVVTGVRVVQGVAAVAVGVVGLAGSAGAEPVEEPPQQNGGVTGRVPSDRGTTVQQDPRTVTFDPGPFHTSHPTHEPLDEPPPPPPPPPHDPGEPPDHEPTD